MGWAHATRNLKHASADTLTLLHDAAAVLIEHHQQISPRVMTDLLLHQQVHVKVGDRARRSPSASRRTRP